MTIVPRSLAKLRENEVLREEEKGVRKIHEQKCAKKWHKYGTSKKNWIMNEIGFHSENY